MLHRLHCTARRSLSYRWGLNMLAYLAEDRSEIDAAAQLYG